MAALKDVGAKEVVMMNIASMMGKGFVDRIRVAQIIAHHQLCGRLLDVWRACFPAPGSREPLIKAG
jgi:hypothetical protein